MKEIFHVLFLLDSTNMFQESNMRIRNLFGYRDSELVYISGSCCCSSIIYTSNQVRCQLTKNTPTIEPKNLVFFVFFFVIECGQKYFNFEIFT